MPDVGEVKLHAGHVDYKPGGAVHITDGFEGESDAYSFAGYQLDGTLLPKQKMPLFQHAVVTGDPGKTGRAGQVYARIQSLEQGYETKIWADTVVYDSDPTHVADGTFTFTGHVFVQSTDNAALAAPGVTTFRRLRVTVGHGSNYPSIEGDELDATFVPNRGSG
jgi:hypothetical protein